jgi:hypothetical protein
MFLWEGLKLSETIMEINDLRELVSPSDHKPDAFSKGLIFSLHTAPQHGAGE